MAILFHGGCTIIKTGSCADGRTCRWGGGLPQGQRSLHALHRQIQRWKIKLWADDPMKQLFFTPGARAQSLKKFFSFLRVFPELCSFIWHRGVNSGLNSPDVLVAKKKPCWKQLPYPPPSGSHTQLPKGISSLACWVYVETWNHKVALNYLQRPEERS